MKHSICLLVIVFVIFSVSIAGAQDTKKEMSVTAVKIDDTLYKLDIQSGFPVNIMLSKGDDGNLLVDTGFVFTADILQKKLQGLGVEKITVLINTHEHRDHTGANSIVNDDTTVIAHEKVKKQLQEGVNLFRLLPQRALPDKTLSTDIKKLNFNGQQVTIIPVTGGHSDSDVIVYFPKSKIVYTGGLTNGRLFPFVDSAKGGTVMQYPPIFKRLLEELPDDITFVPGHGENFTKNELKDLLHAIESSIFLVQTELKANKKPETIAADKRLKQWDSYASGFVTLKVWVKQIYAGLNPKPVKKSPVKPLFTTINAAGVDSFIVHYKKMKKDHGEKYNFNENILNNFGYYLLNTKKDVDGAIKIFELNVLEYPESFNVYDSLAEGYMNKGMTEKAIAYYKKALEIKPDFSNAQKMLQKLKKL